MLMDGQILQTLSIALYHRLLVVTTGYQQPYKRFIRV